MMVLVEGRPQEKMRRRVCKHKHDETHGARGVGSHVRLLPVAEHAVFEAQQPPPLNL